jgi:hypothetical protein
MRIVASRISGSGVQNLIDQRQEISEKIAELFKALDEGFPHPRDYRSIGDWHADLKEWEALAKELRDWQQRMVDEAMALDEMVNRR